MFLIALGNADDDADAKADANDSTVSVSDVVLEWWRVMFAYVLIWERWERLHTRSDIYYFSVTSIENQVTKGA